MTGWEAIVLGLGLLGGACVVLLAAAIYFGTKIEIEETWEEVVERWKVECEGGENDHAGT